MNLILIENRAGKLSLNDVVTPVSIDKMISEMEQLYGSKAVAENHTIGEIVCSAANALESMDIHIHSPGGSVMDGARLYHAIHDMRERGVHVTATINTLAASMGSVIAMAADKVQIVKGGRIMIHEASQGIIGNSEDHARAAKNLDEISNDIAGIYASKTGKEISEMRDLMKKETWMGADEAVEMGFADEAVTFLSNTKPNIEKNQSPKNMGLFTSKPENQGVIIALESENAELRENFTALQSVAADSAERVVQLRSDIVGLTSGIEFATSELTAANTKLATFDAEVETAAQAKFASLGGPPLAVADGDPVGSSNIKTMAEFNAITPAARMAFVKSGGKLTD